MRRPYFRLIRTYLDVDQLLVPDDISDFNTIQVTALDVTHLVKRNVRVIRQFDDRMLDAPELIKLKGPMKP